MKCQQPKVVFKDIAKQYNKNTPVVKLKPSKSKPRGCGAATKGCTDVTVY